MRSIGMNCFAAIGPLPSIGWPSALTTRPTISSPTGTEMMRPVRLTVSPSLISVEWPRSTAPTLSSSRFSAMPNTPCGNSSISPAIARLDAVHARDAVADRHDRADFGDVDVDGVVADLVADDLGDLFGLDVHEFSVLADVPGLVARSRRSCQRAASSHAARAARDAAVVDRAADARDDAADDRRIDPRVELHVAAGRAREPVRERGARSGGSATAVDDLGPDDLLVIHQAVEERLRRRPAGAPADRARPAAAAAWRRPAARAGARDQLLDDRALARDRESPGWSAPAAARRCRRRACANSPRSRSRLHEVGALGQGDVEQGARIAGGGSRDWSSNPAFLIRRG